MGQQSRAVIYCRVSTKQQAEDGTSLQSQELACKKLAAERGYQVDTALKEDYPGTELQRPMLDQLRSGVKQRRWEAVFCYATDRLSRSPIHLALIAEECDRSGVQLTFVSEPLDSSPEGQLLNFVRGWAAQIEREKIRDRTSRGLALRAAQGKIPRGAGRGIYGYRYDSATGTRIAHEEQAPVVRRIFQLSLEGNSLHGICQTLNREGIAAHQGGLWHHTSIRRMLSNPAYKGVQYTNRRKRIAMGGNRFRQVWRDPSEWEEVPGATPPIVDMEIWDRVQTTLAAPDRPRFQAVHRKYWLNGFVYCGCGARMTGYAQEPHLFYYRCRATHSLPSKPRTCTARGVRAEGLEERVWNQIKQVLRDPTVVLRELESQTQADVAIENDIADAGTQLNRLAQEQQRLVRLYRFGEVDDQFIDREMKQVKRRRDALSAQLAILHERRAQTRNFQSLRDGAIDFCDRVAQVLDRLEHDDKRLALAALQTMVVVDLDRAVRLRGILPADSRSLAEPSLR
jgi:site-specific DNA recombinase